MKLLPDNPSLNHLRQQAKDLLAGMRDSNPATTLADAQRSLAGQYGFRTWPDLKAEVDRWSDRVNVADDHVTAGIAHAFGLGSPTGPMRSVTADDMGQVWSLTTDRDRWAARTMDTWIPIVDAETDVTLQRAASAAGVDLPLPRRDKSSDVVAEIHGHAWRVCEWKHSGPPLAAPVSAVTTHHLGMVLAKIHRLALPVDRISPWHASRLSPEPWPDVVRRATAAGSAWAPELADAVPDLTDLDVIGNLPASSDPVLCHNVLGPANTRRRPDGRLTVLCWEHAGGQPPGWELCDALVHWAVDPVGSINKAGARALADGYREEMDSLPPIGIEAFHGASISLTNYVHGLIDEALRSGPGRRDQADRAVRHVLAHLPTRATFERLLAAVS